MISGTTKSGFRFTVDENRLKSKRFMKLLTKLGRAARDIESKTEDEQFELGILEDEYEVFVLGEEQQEELIQFCDDRSETGYATNEDVQAVINEILAEVSKRSSEAKNS